MSEIPDRFGDRPFRTEAAPRRRPGSGRAILVALALIAPTPAFAHPGHGHGFVAGMLHPLTGMDHLLAMLMVGLWAGIAFRRHAWVCPAAFVGFMIGGFAYGAMGGVLPFAELLIAASLIVLGLALAFDLRPPLGIAAPMVALFAIGHGFAHGVEMPPGDSRGFAAGFVLTTVALHIAGLALARIATRRAGRLAGMGATAAALVLLWSS